MLHSQKIPVSGAYLDEETILSAMFADPVPPSAVQVNVNRVGVQPTTATTHDPLRGDVFVDDDVNVNDESSLLNPDPVAGYWKPIRDDFVDRVSFLSEGDHVRFQFVPKIWQCVKNAFIMPPV